MLKPRWRKVLRDLWLNKNRTIVVVLSIAVGVFAVGTIASSQIILSRDLSAAYLATNPAQATLMTFEPFGKDVVDAVSNMREVKEAEARRRVTLRVQTGPDEWQLLWLSTIQDFNDIKIDKFDPEAGDWPPPDHEMLIERSALGLLKAKMGDTVTVKTADGKIKEMRIAGLAHDLNAQMYVFDGVAIGYTTVDTLEWLGQPNDYNEIRVLVADPGNGLTKDYIKEVAAKVSDKIENAGPMVWFTMVPDPGKHIFLDPTIQAISYMMGALALLSLLLSGFLVINTISALITQQTRQIGMMKSVGATTRQVLSLYLVTVTIFGLLALFIAVPLGVVGAFLFSRFIASFLNFDVTNLRLPTEVLVAQVAVGLLVPLVAAIFPIMAGVRITVREAISEYGLGKGQFGSSLIDRLLLKIQNITYLRRRLSRPLLLSLRNTFRRKIRLSLTLLTLILGGAIFITVFTVRVTMLTTLTNWMAYFQYDVAVQFERPYRVERLIRETLDIPGVVEAETWGFYNTRRERPDGSTSDAIYMYAPPAETKLVNPTIVRGRWLEPGDENALVVNTLMLRNEPDLDVGSEIVLKMGGRKETFQIVGVATGGFPIPTMFANYPYFARVAHSVGEAEWVFTGAEEHSIEYQDKIARSMEDRFEYLGMDVGLTSKSTEEITETTAIFEVIIVLLLIMAVLLAVIGGLGLMGTMSINVLERTREIGVMRAIGASNRSVRRIFITEGVIIGLISWLIGAIVAYPISKGLSNVVGQQFLNTPLDFTFSITGVVIWLGVVIVLAAVSSFLPAWNASRMTVQEVLAYE